MFSRDLFKISIASLMMMVCFEAVASVVINGTRLIYSGGEREVTVKLNNNGNSPALVQTWIDDGDPKSTPMLSKAPFIISPPVFRMDSKVIQNLRVIFTGKELPQDKESIYWFNLLEVPAQSNSTNVTTNMLQMAFRSRIKLFYRPKSLGGSSSNAPEQVKWRVMPRAKEFILEAHNSSAFYITVTSVRLLEGGRSYSSEGEMIGPGMTHEFVLPSLKEKPGSEAKVEFNTLNDFGLDVITTRQLSL